MNTMKNTITSRLEIAGKDINIAYILNLRFSFLDISLIGFISRPILIILQIFVCDSRLNCEKMHATRTTRSIMLFQLKVYARTPSADMFISASIRNIRVERRSSHKSSCSVKLQGSKRALSQARARLEMVMVRRIKFWKRGESQI